MTTKKYKIYMRKQPAIGIYTGFQDSKKLSKDLFLKNVYTGTINLPDGTEDKIFFNLQRIYEKFNNKSNMMNPADVVDKVKGDEIGKFYKTYNRYLKSGDAIEIIGQGTYLICSLSFIKVEKFE